MKSLAVQSSKFISIKVAQLIYLREYQLNFFALYGHTPSCLIPSRRHDDPMKFENFLKLFRKIIVLDIDFRTVVHSLIPNYRVLEYDLPLALKRTTICRTMVDSQVISRGSFGLSFDVP